VSARTDRTRDPSILADLGTARHGTAYFARALAKLSDTELRNPSRLTGWTNAHIAAHVGYNARALCRLLEWAETGDENPMYSSPEQRREEIDLGASLRPDALRNLVHHAAIHLDVSWRDLSPDAWSRTVRTAQGRVVPASETVWMRSREVWVHAVDLSPNSRFDALPSRFLDRLLADVTGTWRTRGEQVADLVASDRAGSSVVTDDGSLASGPCPPHVLHGVTADLTRWATGRGGPLQETAGNPPRWL